MRFAILAVTASMLLIAPAPARADETTAPAPGAAPAYAPAATPYAPGPTPYSPALTPYEPTAAPAGAAPANTPPAATQAAGTLPPPAPVPPPPPGLAPTSPPPGLAPPPPADTPPPPGLAPPASVVAQPASPPPGATPAPLPGGTPPPPGYYPPQPQTQSQPYASPPPGEQTYYPPPRRHRRYGGDSSPGTYSLAMFRVGEIAVMQGSVHQYVPYASWNPELELSGTAYVGLALGGTVLTDAFSNNFFALDLHFVVGTRLADGPIGVEGGLGFQDWGSSGGPNPIALGSLYYGFDHSVLERIFVQYGALLMSDYYTSEIKAGFGFSF